MARLRTLTNMTADVRNRSGLENSTFRTDNDIMRYLNESGYKLTGLILANFPESNFLYKSNTISVTSGTTSYALPDDCFQPYLFRVTVDGERMDIPRADIEDLDMETSNAGWSRYSNRPHHRIMGYDNSGSGGEEQMVRFMPTPTASYTVTCHYIPQAPFVNFSGTATRLSDMSSGGHQFMSEWGWEEWLVLDTSIKIKNDAEEDASVLLRERAEWWDIIANLVKNRTVTKPHRIRDVFTEPGHYTRRRDRYRYY